MLTSLNDDIIRKFDFRGRPMNVSNPGENPQRRALLQALDEAKEQFDALPFNSRERPKLALLMVQLEDRLLVVGE